MSENTIQTTVSESAEQNRSKKFLVELFDEVTNDNGDVVKYKKVVTEQPVIIEASNRIELDEHMQRFKLCGQRAKIIKVIDENIQPASISSNNDVKQIKQISEPASITATNINHSNMNSVERTYTVKPKYYKIGDIEIKDDNGKIYQKQWMKLSDSEASNLRIINDKNNSIVNIAGKHIEMKKWVLVEKSEQDEATSIEESLNEQI